jgi:hypothetical protein
MTEDELKFPKWQEPLRQAILEHDPIRLVEKTEKVEATIRERLLQLRMNNSDCDTNQLAEEQALMDALNVIRIILRNRVA